MKLKIFPRRFFIKSKKHLVYVDITKTLNFIFILGMSLMLVIGFLLGKMKRIEKIIEVEVPIEIYVEFKHDMAVGDMEWKDSVFTEYYEKASLYLSQDVFTDTPIKAEMLSLAARNAYDSTGVLLPLELALSQAQWESNMGRHGRSPEKNPYNIGEYDTGTVLYFESTFDGIQEYYYLMCTNYLSCKSLNELFMSFTNCSGRRYASADRYEITIKYQYYHIKEWLKENYENYNKFCK